MPQSNGGVSVTSRLTLYPMQSITGKGIAFYAFDPSQGFNETQAGSFYTFKVEEVLPNRVPTIGQIIIKYRDLGIVLVLLTLTGVSDQQIVNGVSQQQVVSQQIPLQLGNQNMTGRLMTTIVGQLGFTAKDVQLTITRQAGAGSLSIAKVVMCGRIEVTQVFA